MPHKRKGIMFTVLQRRNILFSYSFFFFFYHEQRAFIENCGGGIVLERLVLFLTLFQACLVTEVKENRLQDSAGAYRFGVPSNCALLALSLYPEPFAGYPLVCQNKSQFQKQHTQASAAPSTKTCGIRTRTKTHNI